MPAKRIKGTRQKLPYGQFGAFVPFGVDAKFVDMDSSLNLQQELLIGRNGNTTIKPDQTAVVFPCGYSELSQPDGITIHDATVIKQILSGVDAEENYEQDEFYMVETIIYDGYSFLPRTAPLDKREASYIDTTLMKVVKEEGVLNQHIIKKKSVAIYPDSDGGEGVNIQEVFR